MKCCNCGSTMILRRDQVPIPFATWFCIECPLALLRTDHNRWGEKRPAKIKQTIKIIPKEGK